MTVVALVEEGIVYMGHDSAFIGPHIMTHNGRSALVGERKIGNVPCLIGVSGSTRVGQLVLYGTSGSDFTVGIDTSSEQNKDLMSWLVTDVCPKFRTLLQGEMGQSSKDGPRPPAVRFLLGVKSSLFLIHPGLEVQPILEGRMAIGIGADLAVGSLYENRESEFTPRERIERALDTAEHHTAEVRRPFHFFQLPT